MRFHLFHTLSLKSIGGCLVFTESNEYAQLAQRPPAHRKACTELIMSDASDASPKTVIRQRLHT